MRLAPGLRSNIGLKTLSLALGLLLWSFVHGSKTVERKHTIPIEYVSLGDSLMFVEPPPSEMRVLLSGPAQDLVLRVHFMRDVVARIDLSGATARLDRVVPSISDIIEPANERVSVIRILSPSIIAFRLSEREHRILPVRVVLDAMPAGYCLVDSPLAIPSEVVCTGPRSLLAGLDEIVTLPFALPKKRGRLVVDAKPATPHPSVQCQTERIQVALGLARLAAKTFERQAITIVPPASADLWVAADTGFADVTVSGPEAQVDAVVAADVGLFLDTSQLEPGRHDSLGVVWSAPEWVRSVRVEPPAIGVTVHLDPESARSAKDDSTSVSQLP